jgi:hypothetical protein
VLLPCCWQALRSLDFELALQKDLRAAATLTQLTRLDLGCEQGSLASEVTFSLTCLSSLTGLRSLLLYNTSTEDSSSRGGSSSTEDSSSSEGSSSTAQGGAQDPSLSCLSTLTALQSLSLNCMALPPGGFLLVGQGCSSLTQLELVECRMLHPPTEQPSLFSLPPPPQAPCSWPALLELRLHDVAPGVVSHVLAGQGSAPLLARLAPSAALHHASWYLNFNEEDEEGQLAEMQRHREQQQHITGRSAGPVVAELPQHPHCPSVPVSQLYSPATRRYSSGGPGVQQPHAVGTC